MTSISLFHYNFCTHIKFVLYKFDYIDSIIISKLKKNYTNYSKDSISLKHSVEDVKHVIKSTPRLYKFVKSYEKNNSSVDLNSAVFIWNLVSQMNNLEYVSFSISDKKDYSRIFTHEGMQMYGYPYKVKAGYLNLSNHLSRHAIDLVNLKLIKDEYMENKYMLRRGYFYFNGNSFINMLAEIDMESNNTEIFNLLNLFDDKIDTDNPVLLVQTDYSMY